MATTNTLIAAMTMALESEGKENGNGGVAAAVIYVASQIPGIQEHELEDKKAARMRKFRGILDGVIPFDPSQPDAALEPAERALIAHVLADMEAGREMCDNGRPAEPS